MRDFPRAIREEAAGLFVGAGLSRAGGFVDWKGLLWGIAADLGLNIEVESDLVAVAQYHVNERGDRSRLNQLLVEEFTKDAKLTENHRLIARMPIRTIWTTNYDRLLEDAFHEARRKLDVKITPENLNTTLPGRYATLYKMHGDIQNPHEAVLTKEDYESYHEKRQLFSEALKGDLVSKSFLFLGFSFEDPNIDYILSRIRVLLGVNKRPHYCVMKRLDPVKGLVGKARADQEYRKRKMELRIADLKRYSIQPLLIEDYEEITEILRAVSLRVRLSDVFVSGAAHEFGSIGKDRMEDLCTALGETIMDKGFNLVSGFGLDVGGRVLAGAIQACRRHGVPLEDRLTLRPFPQALPPDVQREVWGTIREDLIDQAGFAVFVAGNKLDHASNKVVVSDGMKAEIDLAKAKGRFLVPIGATGYLAKELWNEVSADLGQRFAGLNVRAEFDIIGDAARSNREIINAVTGILQKVQEKS